MRVLQCNEVSRSVPGVTDQPRCVRLWPPRSLAFQLTNGQPWLVNALAREATTVVERDRSCSLTREVIEAARERVVACQDTHTHLGWLVERVREDRVRHMLEFIVAGAAAPNVSRDDVRYMLDIGLVQWSGEGVLEIANPIYDGVVRSCLHQSAH